ncbi:MAG: sterol desaturase family protein [Bacteroidota bacterium]
MQTITYILITVLTFLVMEFAAWLTHRFVMHGLLWTLHEDHHQPHKGFFEKNDLFFLIFAAPSILLFYEGSANGLDWRFFAGLGILLYGICYFLVHDVFIHRRFNWLRNADSVYFRALRKAHKVHHKHLDRFNGECFGMLLVPYKYWREAKLSKKNERTLPGG